MIRKLTNGPRRVAGALRDRYVEAFDVVNPVDRPRDRDEAKRHPFRLGVTVVVVAAAVVVSVLMPFLLEFVVLGVVLWIGAHARGSRLSRDADDGVVSRIRRGDQK